MHHTIPAPADLSDWLECAVVVHAASDDPPARFPAMVSAMLVVRLAGDVRREGQAVPAAALIGASTGSTEYAHTGPVHAVGLVLRPEALGPLCGAALWPITNRVVPVAQVAGVHWPAIERAVRAATDDAARVEALWRFVRQAVAASPVLEARRQRLQDLARAACGEAQDERIAHMGLRQFERHFRAGFGMSPKQFQVIARLNRMLRLAAAAGRPDVHLVLEQGYYDQSHMARDMRRLAGGSLGTLVAAATQPTTTAHWPLRVGAQSLPQGDVRKR